MSAILPRLERRPPLARGRPASPGKPFFRPHRPKTPSDTFATLGPLLRAAVVLIGLTLLLFALDQAIVELVDRVRVLLVPRI